MMEVCPLEAFPHRRAHYDGSVLAWRHSHTEELIMMEVCLHGGILTQKTSYYGSVPAGGIPTQKSSL